MAIVCVPGSIDRPPFPANVQPAKLTSAADSDAVRAQDHLFVNKNVDSEFSSINRVATIQGRSAIFSHVQRFRHRQNPKSHSASTSTSATTSIKRAVHSVSHRPTRRRPQSSTSRTTAPQSPAVSCKSRAALLRGTREGDTTKRAAPQLCSNNFLPGDACDPFNTTAVRINQSNHDLVQFFSTMGWKAHLKTFHHTNTDQWSQSYKDIPSLVKRYLCDEMHMNVFVTLNAVRLNFYKVRTLDQAHNPELLMAKSLRSLQVSVSNFSIAAADELIVLDIFFLAFVEFYRQNYDVMRMHLEMIRRLVSLLGGFTTLCPYIREACCFSELCFAIETGQQPVFDMTWHVASPGGLLQTKSWDPGPLHQTPWVELKLALQTSKDRIYGTGFDDALRDGFFNRSTTRIIEELLVDMQALEFVRKDKHPLPSDIEWACFRCRAYLHRLLSLPRPDKDSPLQQCRIYCVTTTLLITFCYECTYVSAVRSGKLVLTRLKDFLHLGISDTNQMEYDWGRQNQMLLWIMVVGACIAEGGVEEKWFLDRAILGCRALNVDRHKGLQDLMSRYMGLGDVQARGLRRLAGYLEDDTAFSG